MSDRVTRLQQIVEPTLEAMGYGLVRVQLSAGGSPTLQVMAERQDGQAMSLDDCTAISRALSARLDADDPIDTAYSLEVSSPGVERPLVRPADFTRFRGCRARIETRVKIGERRKFAGRIAEADDNAVTLELDPGAERVEIDYGRIVRAKLTPDDEPAAPARKKPDHRSTGTMRS